LPDTLSVIQLGAGSNSRVRDPRNRLCISKGWIIVKQAFDIGNGIGLASAVFENTRRITSAGTWPSKGCAKRRAKALKRQNRSQMPLGKALWRRKGIGHRRD
jgi:hypothetical protein